MSTVGERIKEARKLRRQTQKALAEKVGLTATYIYLLEAEREKPSDRTLRDISRELRVREKWLRTGEGERDFPPEDEEAAFVAELLGNKDNPVYDLIKSIMKTYSQLSENNKLVLQEFCQKLKENQ